MKGGPSYTADVLSSLPVMILNGRVGLKSQVFTGLKDGKNILGIVVQYWLEFFGYWLEISKYLDTLVLS